MNQHRKIVLTVLLSVLALITLTFSACSGGSSTTTTSPATTTTGTTGPGGAVINSDSVITGTIKDIRPQTEGYHWELDVLVKTSENVGDLPNPTADKIGQVVTLKTDEDMSQFKSDEDISAKVKYTGDVPKPGITLYIYNIKAK